MEQLMEEFDCCPALRLFTPSKWSLRSCREYRWSM